MGNRNYEASLRASVTPTFEALRLSLCRVYFHKGKLVMAMGKKHRFKVKGFSVFILLIATCGHMIASVHAYSDEEELATNTVINFVKALRSGSKEQILPYLTGEAKATIAQWPDVFGICDPRFEFKILRITRLGDTAFEFIVAQYEEYTGYGIVGYYDLTLLVEKIGNSYLISSMQWNVDFEPPLAWIILEIHFHTYTSQHTFLNRLKRLDTRGILVFERVDKPSLKHIIVRCEEIENIASIIKEHPEIQLISREIVYFSMRDFLTFYPGWHGLQSRVEVWFPDDFKPAWTLWETKRCKEILEDRINDYGLINSVVGYLPPNKIMLLLQTEDSPEIRQLVTATGGLLFQQVIKLAPAPYWAQRLYDRDGALYIVDINPLLGGEVIENAYVHIQQGIPYMTLTLRPKKAAELRDAINRMNVGDQIAVVILMEKGHPIVYSILTITEALKDMAHNAVQTLDVPMRCSIEEAKVIATLIRQPAMPTYGQVVEVTPIRVVDVIAPRGKPEESIKKFNPELGGFSFSNGQFSDWAKAKGICHYLSLEEIMQSYQNRSLPFQPTLPFYWFVYLLSKRFHELGHCYGLSAAALDYYLHPKKVPEGKKVKDLSMEEACDEIEYYQTAWVFDLETVTKGLLLTLGSISLEAEYELVKQSIDGGEPVLIALYGGKSFIYHNVVGYDYEETGDRFYVYIYDPNYPQVERMINLRPDGQLQMAPYSSGGEKFTRFVCLGKRKVDYSIWDNMLGILVHSPVKVHIYDAQGKHVGLTHEGIELGFPAIYLHDDEAVIVLIPSYKDDYKLEIVGTGKGYYHLIIAQTFRGQKISEQWISEEVVPNIVHIYSLNVTEQGTQVKRMQAKSEINWILIGIIASVSIVAFLSWLFWHKGFVLKRFYRKP